MFTDCAEARRIDSDLAINILQICKSKFGPSFLKVLLINRCVSRSNIIIAVGKQTKL